MATQSSNFAALRDPGLRLIYGDAYGEYPEEYSKIFDVQSSQRAYEDALSMSGFGVVPVKAEGKSVSYDDPIQGPTRRQTHVTYGKGFIVTREMHEDDLYKKMNALPKALARSVRITIEQIASDILNNGFTTTLTVDGLSLFNASHTLLGGGTFANRPTIAADLDMTSLEQAIIDVAAFVDERGLLVYAKGKQLIVPPALDWQSKRLIKSPDDPETANRSINPAAGSLTPMTLHYLTDPDAWFVNTDVPNGLIFYWRRRPEFGFDNDSDSENAKWKTTLRFSAGADDPRAMYASPGA